MAQNTVFSVNPDFLAMLTGTGAVVANAQANPTYAATINTDPSQTLVVDVITNPTVGNATINALTGGRMGQQLTFIIENDSGGARTITFGTNLRATGTVVGTASKAIIVDFISNGTAFIETGRSSAAA